MSNFAARKIRCWMLLYPKYKTPTASAFSGRKIKCQRFHLSEKEIIDVFFCLRNTTSSVCSCRKITYQGPLPPKINCLRLVLAKKWNIEGFCCERNKISKAFSVRKIKCRMPCAPVNRCAGQSLTDSDDIRCSIDTIRPPEDEQRTAWNM